MTKYKYYFQKPKSEIVKDMLLWIAAAGVVYVAASSPYFIMNIMKAYKKSRKYGKKKVYDTFYNLKRQGCIRIENQNHQTYISLTAKGKKRAGWFQIDNLKIKRPKKWDGKWRIIVFDIIEFKKAHREAFRGKLKELGFRPLQKSVWVHPFVCKDEIDLLRDFFGLTEKEIRLVVADYIGNDEELKEIFKL